MRSNYERSNAITTVEFSVHETARTLVQQLLETEDAAPRQKISSALLDALCDCAAIDICNVKISDTQQYHKKSRGRTVLKRYGYYRPQSRYIYIQNRTAVRGQILANKTFLDTLLHEWLHHYDTCKLHLNSIHTSGFFARLNSLKEKLGA